MTWVRSIPGSPRGFCFQCSGSSLRTVPRECARGAGRAAGIGRMTAGLGGEAVVRGGGAEVDRGGGARRGCAVDAAGAGRRVAGVDGMARGGSPLTAARPCSRGIGAITCRDGGETACCTRRGSVLGRTWIAMSRAASCAGRGGATRICSGSVRTGVRILRAGCCAPSAAALPLPRQCRSPGRWPREGRRLCACERQSPWGRCALAALCACHGRGRMGGGRS